MKYLALIQARSGSTRLPGKVLLMLEGSTVLEHVIERVCAVKTVDEAIVVTTLSFDDLPILRLCAEIGTRVCTGSEFDVLDRFYQCCKIVRPQNIVRITADCPLLDPAVIDKVIGEHDRCGSDYTSNVLVETYPDGEDVEVFTFQSLEKAWKEAQLASEREHVTPYIRNHPELFRLASVENDCDLSRKRWTLDTDKDYVFISNIYSRLFLKKRLFGMIDVLELLEKEPELERVNRNIRRNEGYEQALKQDCRRQFPGVEARDP